MWVCLGSQEHANWKRFCWPCSSFQEQICGCQSIWTPPWRMRYEEDWAKNMNFGKGEQFQWSVLDRWPTHPGFLKALEQRVQAGLDDFDENVRDLVVVVFSAHSLPMKVVNRGDQYVPEVAATANAVMER